MFMSEASVDFELFNFQIAECNEMQYNLSRLSAAENYFWSVQYVCAHDKI